MSTWKELRDNPRLKTIYDQRCQIIRLTREFFWSQGFVETDTPIALKLPGQEPYLHPVPVTFHSPLGETEQFYLHTSPEFALKKLLAAGYEKNFSLVKCFRDYEAFGDGTHNTEFTMLEWYRAPGTYQDFMDDTERLFKYVGKKMGITFLKYGNATVPLDAGGWDRKTMKQLWQDYISVNLDEYLALETMVALATSKGYMVAADDAYEDVFFKIFLNEIEPKLGYERPIFVYDYPRQMCSLSRLCPGNNRYAERAELYVAGLELANGFGELLEAAEQEKRLTEDQQLRAKLGKPTWPIDPDFIAALASGIPAKTAGVAEDMGLAAEASAKAGGIALGIDRMIVLFTGARSINEVLFQSVKDQLSESTKS